MSFSYDITDRQQANQELQRHAARLAILHQVAHAILGVQSVEAVVAAVLSRVRDLLPVAFQATVALADQAFRELFLFALDSTAEGKLKPGLPISVAEFGDVSPILDQLRQGGVHTLDFAALRNLPSPFRPSAGERPAQILLFPLITRGTLIGTFNLGVPSGHELSGEDMQTAREIVDLLSLAFQNAQLFDRLRAGRERLQSLSQQLIQAQETERRRLARELHDEIGQALTAVKINLQAAQRDMSKATVPVEDSVGIVERTLQQVRQISLDLHPSLLDDLGLVAALRWYVDRHAQRTGLTAQFISEPIDERPSVEIETACFRVVQEALTNIARHAHARSFCVELRQRPGADLAPEIELVVRDDGIGFDVQGKMIDAAHGKSLGLLGIQERAMLLGGHVQIDSAPGDGTTIRAWFPQSPHREQRIERTMGARDK
jgi:signal transduction histidine kinase